MFHPPQKTGHVLKLVKYDLALWMPGDLIQSVCRSCYIEKTGQTMLERCKEHLWYGINFDFLKLLLLLKSTPCGETLVRESVEIRTKERALNREDGLELSSAGSQL